MRDNLEEKTVFVDFRLDSIKVCRKEGAVISNTEESNNGSIKPQAKKGYLKGRASSNIFRIKCIIYNLYN